MSFRTVVITKQSRLNYKNKFLVVKTEEEEKYIHLSEIDTVVVDSISVSISSYLLKELSDNKINIIFCDEKHNPFGELISYYSKFNTSKQIMNQIKWTRNNKEIIWMEIIKNKIYNQSFMLRKIASEKYDLVYSYIDEVKLGDKTNREGHAAKVYFSELYGQKFKRSNDISINAALNYGYAILLSNFSKEISVNGYITQLGIHHKNEYNQFNLSCDFMEPFRVIIDNFVFYNQDREFDRDYKMDILNIFNNKYDYLGKKYTLKDIIKMYVKNNLNFNNENFKYKGFYYNER